MKQRNKKKKIKLIVSLLLLSNILISCEKPKQFTGVYYTSTDRKEYVPQVPKLEDMQIEDTSNFKVEEKEVTSPTTGEVATTMKTPLKSARGFFLNVKDEKEMNRILEASQAGKDSIIFIKNKEVLDKEENKGVKEYYENVILKESNLKDYTIIEVELQNLTTPYIYSPAGLHVIDYAKDKDLAFADPKGIFLSLSYDTKEKIENKGKKGNEPATLEKDVKYVITIESLSKVSTALDAKKEIKKLGDYDVPTYETKGMTDLAYYKQNAILGVGGLTANIIDLTKTNQDKKLKQEQIDVLLNNVSAYIVKIQKDGKIISIKEFYSN